MFPHISPRPRQDNYGSPGGTGVLRLHFPVHSTRGEPQLVAALCLVALGVAVSMLYGVGGEWSSRPALSFHFR